MNALATIVTAVFSYVAIKIKTAYEKKVASYKAQAKHNWLVETIDTIVVALGTGNREGVVSLVTKFATSNGLNISTDDIDILVDAAIQGIDSGIHVVSPSESLE